MHKITMPWGRLYARNWWRLLIRAPFPRNWVTTPAPKKKEEGA